MLYEVITGDDGEGHLEHAEHGFRNTAFKAGAADVMHQGLTEPADPGVHGAAVAEGQAVAVQHPQDRHHAGNRETLHQHGQHVLVVITSYSIHYTKLYEAESLPHQGELDVLGVLVAVADDHPVLGRDAEHHHQLVITSYSIHYTKLYEGRFAPYP